MDDRQFTHDPERIDALIARCLSGDAESTAADIERDGLWEYVAFRACTARVGGALIAALRQQQVKVLAWPAMELQAQREWVEAANAFSTTRVAPVLAGLRAHQVPFLLLKGAALNAVLYDDPGARPMVDVDILIRPADVKRADEALMACGCTPGAELLRDDFYPRYYNEREYFTPGRPRVKIDVHARPLRPLRYTRTMPDDALWDSPLSATYGGVRVLVPNAENMLIHLAAHAACHGLGELKWLMDIRLWLDRFGDRLGLATLGEKCRRWKLTLPVRRALEEVAEVFGETTPIIEPAIRAVSGPAGLRDRLALLQAPRDAEHTVAMVLVNLLCTPGARFRLGYLKSVLLPDRAHLGQLYHRRHRGWILAAHVTRVLRGLLRPFLPATPAPA